MHCAVVQVVHACVRVCVCVCVCVRARACVRVHAQVEGCRDLRTFSIKKDRILTTEERGRMTLCLPSHFEITGRSETRENASEGTSIRLIKRGKTQMTPCLSTHFEITGRSETRENTSVDETFYL